MMLAQGTDPSVQDSARLPHPQDKLSRKRSPIPHYGFVLPVDHVVL